VNKYSNKTRETAIFFGENLGNLNAFSGAAITSL
jgi:hypothetical protein